MSGSGDKRSRDFGGGGGEGEGVRGGGQMLEPGGDQGAVTRQRWREREEVELGCGFRGFRRRVAVKAAVCRRRGEERRREREKERERECVSGGYEPELRGRHY